MQSSPVETQQQPSQSEQPMIMQSSPMEMQPPPMTPQDLSQVSVSNQNDLPSDVSNSFNVVVDYMTSKIADKIKNDMNLSTSDPSNMQNGFNAVSDAAEQIARGGKRTRRFRLTKKHKTNKKHSK
jgi:hypothetical protein